MSKEVLIEVNCQQEENNATYCKINMYEVKRKLFGLLVNKTPIENSSYNIPVECSSTSYALERINENINKLYKDYSVVSINVDARSK